MNCFPCFRSRSMNSNESKDQGIPGGDTIASGGTKSSFLFNLYSDTKIQKATNGSMMEEVNQAEIAARAFNFRELATATRNFRQECLLGEGGFGRVYKGTLASTGQIVAVKQLDRHGLPGSKEFLAGVLKLSLLQHENLVKLIGYCADGDQRLLVYEFMPGGSVQDHLLDISTEQTPLDWFTRMKIAFGACKGLEYLHDKANLPIVYCDLKPSNILLDKEFNPKLSDFGLTQLSPSGDKLHIAPRAMGTYGYCAPEYQRSGQLTKESDVYSFGVVLLELISGRRAVDTTKPIDEQNLVTWAQPFFRDPKKFSDLADPLLDKHFPDKDLNQVVAIAAMCLQEEPTARPLMSDVATTLSFLSVVKETIVPTPQRPATPPVEESVGGDHNQQECEAGDSSDSQNDNDSENNDHSDSEDGESVDRDDCLLSLGEGIIGNHGISTISRDRSVSLESNGNCGSYDGSISSSENSSTGSCNNNDHLSQKSSKISRHSVRNKSRKASEEGSYYTSCKSSRKSQKLTASMSRGSSIDSCDEIRL